MFRKLLCWLGLHWVTHVYNLGFCWKMCEWCKKRKRLRYRVAPREIGGEMACEIELYRGLLRPMQIDRLAKEAFPSDRVRGIEHVKEICLCLDPARLRWHNPE